MNNIKDLLEKYKQIEGERFFKELFEGEEYKPILDMKCDVVLDVGVLAGEFSAYIYDKAHIIYALEPYSKHYKELEENIEEFKLTKIKPFNLALSNMNNTADLQITSRGGHSIGSEGNKEQVRCKTLATFIKEQGIEHIDVLKIDIEGGESAVFTSEDFKDVADRISVIIGEHFHGLEDLMTSYGFKGRTYMNNFIYEREIVV